MQLRENRPHQDRHQQERSRLRRWSVGWISEPSKESEEGEIAEEAQSAESVPIWVNHTSNPDKAPEDQGGCCTEERDQEALAISLLT